jgi:hypothetical protein
VFVWPTNSRWRRLNGIEWMNKWTTLLSIPPFYGVLLTAISLLVLNIAKQKKYPQWFLVNWKCNPFCLANPPKIHFLTETNKIFKQRKRRGNNWTSCYRFMFQRLNLCSSLLALNGKTHKTEDRKHYERMYKVKYITKMYITPPHIGINSEIYWCLGWCCVCVMTVQ